MLNDFYIPATTRATVNRMIYFPEDEKFHKYTVEVWFEI